MLQFVIQREGLKYYVTYKRYLCYQGKLLKPITSTINMHIIRLSCLIRLIEIIKEKIDVYDPIVYVRIMNEKLLQFKKGDSVI